MDFRELARLIDHTALQPETTEQQIHRLCDEALHWNCAAVCVNSSRIPLVARLLIGSKVKPCAVVGFPLGAAATSVKSHEAAWCIERGALEIDMVMNIGLFRDARIADARVDIEAVQAVCGDDIGLKVILETALLSLDEVALASRMAVDGGATFVKTSTGFNKAGGASVDSVKVMRHAVGPGIGVKASGGIRDAEAAIQMVAAGATRLGISSTVAILTELSGISY